MPGISAKKHLANFIVMNRKKFITTSVKAVAVAGLISPFDLSAQQKYNIKAVVFDAFTIFNTNHLNTLVEEYFPGKANELNTVWRVKQFDYCWLRILGNKYSNFQKITADALLYAAKKVNVTLTSEMKTKLLEEFMRLDIYPDVPGALKQLKDMGLKLAYLSNMTEEMLVSCSKHAGISHYFDEIISTDSIQTYKPHPHAYQLGMQKLGLKKEEILFAAFGGWDATGSDWFGYKTFWVNRAGVPAEELGINPYRTGNTLLDLSAYAAELLGK